MTWLAASLVSAFCLGLYDVAKKAALRDNAVLPVLLLSSLCGLGLLVTEWLCAQSGLFALVPLGPRPLDASQHLAVAAKSLLVSTSWVFNFLALKHLPISLASPVRATAPVFTILGALLLFRERPTAAQWIGMAIVVCAYLAFSAIGRLEGISFTKDRWVACLVLGTLLGAASSLYDKYLLSQLAFDPFTLQLWFTIYSAALQAALCLWWWRRSPQAVRVHWRTSIALVGVLLVVADQFYFGALATDGALISIVSVLRRTNVIVSFGVGSLLFRERLLGRKAVALAAVLAGLVLLLKG